MHPNPNPNCNHAPVLFPLMETPQQGKTLVSKKVDKKRTARAPVKRRYKVRVITQPLPATPTPPVNPIPACCTYPYSSHFYCNQSNAPMKSAATSILVTVYNLAQGKFEGIPYPTGRPQVEENPSTPATVHPNKGNNLKLYPMPQPYRSERTPHGLTLCLPQQTCLRPGQIGQFPHGNTCS